jgi:hypothetical protein
VDGFDFLERAGVELGGAADAVEADGPALRKAFRGLRAHAALADDGADAIAAEDFGLIRLFAVEVVGPAALTTHCSPFLSMTGPQW